MTAPLVLRRQSSKVAQDTVEGTTQCALRFLGYCYRHRGRRQVSLALLLDVARYEQFLQWLLEARQLALRTLLQYLNCAINVAKFLTRDEALLRTADGSWRVDLRKYETFKFYGPVNAVLHESLCAAVEEYITECRTLLLRHGQDSAGDGTGSRAADTDSDAEQQQDASDHAYVFVNGDGQPFGKSAWTTRLQDIFARRNDGQRISPNILRDSFVTYAYSRGIVPT